MKKVTFVLIAVAIAVAVLLSSAASAQEIQRGMGKNMPAFTDCDLDGDGMITEDEFAKARSARIAKRAQEGRQMKNLANAPTFDDIDVDDNGGIDPDEFAAHQAERKAKRG